MGTAKLEDAQTLSERFLEVIFSDPDLFEAAFASVVASRAATPPDRPGTACATTPPPGRWQGEPGPSEHQSGFLCPRGGPAWLLRTARSPPGGSLRWAVLHAR
jgi:hypothetical protein